MREHNQRIDRLESIADENDWQAEAVAASSIDPAEVEATILHYLPRSGSRIWAEHRDEILISVNPMKTAFNYATDEELDEAERKATAALEAE